MFAITSKVKIAAGIAAGALALGAAGAYAANATNTITTYSLAGGSLSHGGQSLKLVSTSPNATLTLPSTPFKNEGQCTKFFATNKTLALQPTSGTTVKRNYHGKLLSGAQKYCATYQTANGTGDTAETETSDATQSGAETDSSDSTVLQSGASHSHGHGHGAD